MEGQPRPRSPAAAAPTVIGEIIIPVKLVITAVQYAEAGAAAAGAGAAAAAVVLIAAVVGVGDGTEEGRGSGGGEGEDGVLPDDLVDSNEDGSADDPAPAADVKVKTKTKNKTAVAAGGSPGAAGRGVAAWWAGRALLWLFRLCPIRSEVVVADGRSSGATAAAPSASVVAAPPIRAGTGGGTDGGGGGGGGEPIVEGKAKATVHVGARWTCILRSMIVKLGYAFLALAAVLVGINLYAHIAYDSEPFSEEELLRLIEEFPFPPLPWEDGPV
jgi:hypothetical protein